MFLQVKLLKMQEKISVIMSVYKESKEELRQSIESIINQSYKNIEFIIIIDNPEEKWREKYIKNINDQRIKLIINPKNIGLPKSLNKGIAVATGKYIARMDADDISLYTRLEDQLKFLKDTNCDICGANVTCFINGKDFKTIQFPSNPSKVTKLLYIKNCVSHPTYFAKKEVYEKLKGYNNIFSCEDYDFLLRCVQNNIKIGNCPKVLLRYRISPGSISRKNPGRQELIAEYLRKFYKKHFKEIVTEQMINDYTMSKEFNKKLHSYDKYWGLKNERSKYKEKKGIKYYWLTLMLIINLKHSVKEIYIKLYEKIIMIGDNK